MTQLKDKIVFITGATAGIGKACAEHFAREKAKVIITARREEKLKALADELSKEHGIDILPRKMDVSNYDEVKYVIENLPDEWKSVDILINNAGLALGFRKMYEEDDISNWHKTIDVNVKGLLNVTYEIMPTMIKKKDGHIVNLGSTAGHEVYPNGNVYCATKYAVKSLTKSLRIELLDKNIKVTTIDPGMVETEFSKTRFFGDEEKAENVYKGVDALTADDIADAVIYAVSRPKHVNIYEMIITPAQQASSNFTVRREE